jgi:hypothetical protein
MPARGRPRLTPEAYAARLSAYCARYAVQPTAEDLPPYPAGQRETPQHREWISLYKARARLARRARGVCERCPEPVSDGSVFCETHRSTAAGTPSSATGASPDARKRLLKAQSGRCPVCAEKVDLGAAVHHDRADGKPRALLHAGCGRLVAAAEQAGPEALDKARAYLWPTAPKARRRPD